MAEDSPFERWAEEYDGWYDRYAAAYRSELWSIRPLLGSGGRSLEVGVGTGRFAAPLGIDVGVDPASAMLRRARGRDVRAIRAVGEELPLRSGCFDRVLIALTLCFLDSPEDALSEVGRVLRPHGRLVVAYLDSTSPAGRARARERTGRFYETAVFRTPEEIEDLLGSAGFAPARTVQTLTRSPEEMDEPERPRPGRGEGMFVVVQALPRPGANRSRGRGR